MLLFIVFSVVFNLFIGTEASCEIPLSPEHGKLHLLGNSQVDSIALYSCDNGWNLVGASASKCLITGEWTSPAPKCVKNSISCEAPKHPVNGIVTYTTLNVGSELKFVCNNGYHLQDTRAVYCTSDREWSKTDVKCVAKRCDRPEHPENGQVIFTSLNFGSQLKFKCNDGYLLKPNDPVLCTSDGTWNNTEVQCLETPLGSVSEATSTGNVNQDPPTTSSAPPDNNCSCTYNSHDRKLAAEVNGLGLWHGDKARKGDKLTLRCYDPAKHLVLPNATSISATLELTCDVCQIWEDGDLPSCEDVGSGLCILSVIPNGSLGHMEKIRVSRYKTEERFVEFQVGRIFKHDETAIFRCKVGFAPIKNLQSFEDLRRSDEVVTCKGGQWSQSLDCKSESCYGEPPPMDNGYPVVNGRSHGYIIYYRCNKYYMKATKGMVRCSYGQWIGHSPTCIDGRCYVSQLNHPGLEKPQVDFIEHQKDYPATCLKGFKASNQWIRVSCDAGKWNVPESICVKEICDNEPPKIRNGRYFVRSRGHNAEVVYECYQGYEMKKHSVVQCLRGEWMGQPPDCDEDVDYDYFEGTESASTTDQSTVDITEDLEELIGEGTIATASPIADKRISRQPVNCFCTFNPGSRYLDAAVNKARLQYGGPVKKGDAALLYCNDPRMHLYWPNGMRTSDVNMTCDVCQAWGSDNLPSCERTHLGDSFIFLNENLKVQPGGAVESRLGTNVNILCYSWNTSYPEWKPPMILRVSYNRKIVDEKHLLFQSFLLIQNFEKQHARRYECFAKSSRPPYYSLRSTQLDLVTSLTCPRIVITNDIEVKYSEGRRVGSTATFSCTDSSLELVGRNFTCLENGTWDRNQKPYCQRISVPDKVTPNPPVSTESTSEKDCVCTYRGKWNLIALYKGLRIFRGTDIRKGESIQLGCFEEDRRLVLPNGTMIMSRSVTWICYRCGAWGASEMPTCEEVQLPAVTCPQLDLTEGITVRYTNERRVGSTATFNCTASYVLDGQPTLQCLQTGVWNLIQPICRTVTCPEFNITEGITVRYTNGRRVGSMATFNCTAPFVLHGKSILRCLTTGNWNRLQPQCQTPGCLIGDFLDIAPDYLLPSMEGVINELQPVGSELNILCEDGKVLVKGKTSTCGPLGKWNFGKVQCVNGCQLNIEDKSSALIIKPDNTYYRVGQSVTMLCLEGFKLTSDVERVMCMEDGWSNPIPNCKKETMK